MPSNVLMFEFLAVDHFAPVAERVSGKLDSVGEKMGRIGKVAAFAIGKVAVGGLAAFGFEMVKGVQSAAEYQTLQLKTAAVIKSTGNQAHLSVSGIDELAHSLQETSGVSESLIINSENVLATFTNIRNQTGKNNDIYNQATARILDLSTAMGEDLQSATVQVGKALNDPIKGMTALQRVGVTFNGTQKEQIKHLVSTGNLMGAQKIILGELNKEFGGAAKAAGSGFAGAMSRVKLALEDSFRDMGTKLLPVLTKVANWFADKLPGAIAATGHGFAVLGGWLAILGQKYGPPLLLFFRNVSTVILQLAQKYGPVIILFLTRMGLGLQTLALKIGPILLNFFRALIPVVRTVATIVGGYLATGIGIVVHYFRDLLFPALRDAGAKIFPQLRTAVATIGAAFRDHMDVIRTFGQVFLFILKVLGVALAALALLLVKVVIPVIAQLIVITLSAVGPIVRALLAITGILITVIKGLVGFTVTATKTIANVIGDIIGAFSNADKWLASAGMKIITGLVRGITAAWPHILTALGHTVDILLGPFKPALVWLFKAGINFLIGFGKGIIAYEVTVTKLIVGVIAKAVGFFTGAVSWLFHSGSSFIVGFLSGIISKDKALFDQVVGVISRISGFFAPARSWLINAGKNIIGGLYSGIASAASNVRTWINDHIVQPVIRWVKWFFGISSPSSVFAGIGVNIIRGLIGGIASMLGKLSGAIRNVVSRVVGFFTGSARWLFNAGFNLLYGFWQGLIAIWHKVTGWIGGIATWIRNNKGPVSLDARLLIPAGKAIMMGFLTGLKSGAGRAWSYVKSIGGKTKEMMAKALGWIPGVGWLSNNIKFGNTGSGGSGFPSGVGRWAGIVRNVLQMEALDTSLVPKVLRQIATESGGNPNIIQGVHDVNWPNNRAEGLLQVIPPTFRAFHWPGTSWSEFDPVANIAAGLNYARHRYGPNLNGLGEGHGYDRGGLARGAGWFRKGPLPERILSPQQTRWFERAMALGARGAAGAHGGASVTVVLSAPNYLGSRDELYAELNRGVRIGRLDSVLRMARGLL